MKKLLLSALALLSMAGIGTAQNLPSYVPANGLVGWWPFNGNANDESGNNNNGIVNGATLTADRFGANNNSYLFSSSNSNYITINSNPIQNGPSSVSGWFYATAPTGGPIFHIGSDNGTPNNCNGYFLGFGNSANPNGNTLMIDASCNGNYNTGWNANSNSWYHFTLIRNQNNLTAYINGNVVGTYNPSAINSPSNSIFFGSTYLSNSVFFNGKLDDIAIYNRALTQQEITALYQGGNTTTNCLDLPTNLQQGLVGYWPFCGNANDESGNGNNGTVNGATLSADRFGHSQKAYQFNGNGSHILVNNSSTLNFSNGTITLWTNTNQTTIGTLICRNDFNSASNEQFHLGINDFFHSNGGLNFYTKYNSGCSPGSGWQTVVSLPTISDSSWKMITGIIRSDSILLYENASLVGKIIAPNPIIDNCQGDIQIGRHWLNDLRYFSGSLDDIGIWNRALSPQEITQLYNQGICKTSITVTDTLLIHTGITAYNPVAYQNTLKVWPNPGNQDITLDAGNLASMQGWKYKVANTLGQTVVNETAISQQQTLIDLSTWGGNGIYYLHLINPQGHAIEIKKIVLAP